MVDPARYRELVERIPDSEYSRYPNLTPEGVRAAVADFLAARE